MEAQSTKRQRIQAGLEHTMRAKQAAALAQQSQPLGSEPTLQDGILDALVRDGPLPQSEADLVEMSRLCDADGSRERARHPLGYQRFKEYFSDGRTQRNAAREFADRADQVPHPPTEQERFPARVDYGRMCGALCREGLPRHISDLQVRFKAFFRQIAKGMEKKGNMQLPMFACETYVGGGAMPAAIHFVLLVDWQLQHGRHAGIELFACLDAACADAELAPPYSGVTVDLRRQERVLPDANLNARLRSPFTGVAVGSLDVATDDEVSARVLQAQAAGAISSIIVRKLAYRDVNLERMVVLGNSDGEERAEVMEAVPVRPKQKPKPAFDFLSLFDERTERSAHRTSLGAATASSSSAGLPLADGVASPSSADGSYFGDLCRSMGLSPEVFDNLGQRNNIFHKIKAAGASLGAEVDGNDEDDNDFLDADGEWPELGQHAFDELGALLGEADCEEAHDAVEEEDAVADTLVAAACLAPQASEGSDVEPPIVFGPLSRPATVAAQYGLKEQGLNYYVFESGETKRAGSLHLIRGERFKATCKQHASCSLMVTCAGNLCEVESKLMVWLAQRCSYDEHQDAAFVVKEGFGMKPRKRTKA